MATLIKGRSKTSRKKYLCKKCGNDTFRIYKIEEIIFDDEDNEKYTIWDAELECLKCGYKFGITNDE